ncbi:MAG: AMP-binding protein, partial [Acidimicrobiales bacterium]|nr:AMP-binding protein [Acidimicrobiales bacterium]
MSGIVRGWIEHQASIRPEQRYLEDARGPRSITYGELLAHCLRWEAQLEEAGVPKGARVPLDLPDHLEYGAAAVALLGAGRVVVPVDPRAPRVGDGSTDPGGRTASRSVPEGPVPERPVPEGPLAEGTGGILLHTSGTTGGRKGVLLREGHLAHAASEVARHHGLGPRELGLCPLPLFHINALVVGLLATLAAGGGLVLDDRFHRHGFWELVDDRGVTWINAVPAIIAILASTEPPTPSPERVRFVRSASAPLPVAVLRRFERRVGISILESYGMTEAASMITANPLQGTRKPGSAGLPAGAEVRVVNGESRLPAGEVGRVQIRGRSVITAYDSGGEPGTFSRDGWLDTKDLGYLDHDGYLFLVARADDVINRGGEKVYPREVEEVLVSHPAVAEAAVVGQPDPVLGARPVAYVVAQEEPGAGAELLAEELRSHCAG